MVIFLRFLFMVAVLSDNNGSFLEVRKKSPSVYTPHQPHQAREERCVDILLTLTWRGGRVELNTALTLPGHKVNTRRAKVRFQKLAAKVLSPLKVKTP